MSRNVVDAAIEWANTRARPLLLIPSRRQVDYNGGYANGWTTATLAAYVRSRTDRVFLQRDHGGPGQGDRPDDGRISLEADCRHFNIVHLDPWKSGTLADGWGKTKALLLYCHFHNQSMLYEIGTEQAMVEYSADQLDDFIEWLKAEVPADVFARIRFAVIQSGTSLHGNRNTGTYDPIRLDQMLRVCDRHGLLSKEHNGDYLPDSAIAERFAAGVNAINIAPEFAQIESATYLEAMQDRPEIRAAYADLVLKSGRWARWLTTDEAQDPEVLINACGHYVLSTPEFAALRSHYSDTFRPIIDAEARHRIKARLDQLHGLT